MPPGKRSSVHTSSKEDQTLSMVLFKVNCFQIVAGRFLFLSEKTHSTENKSHIQSLLLLWRNSVDWTSLICNIQWATFIIN